MNSPDLRKLAADTVGRAALEEWFGPPKIGALDTVLLTKSACADRDLLKVAASLKAGKLLSVYERLGGCFSSEVKE